MSAVLGLPVVVLLLGAGPAEAPSWSAAELRQLFSRIDQAGRAPSDEAYNTELASVGGAAYRVERKPGEPNEPYARRALKERRPDHANIKAGQWVSALLRQFYEDAAVRSGHLARFEQDRATRTYFERMAQAARNAAGQIAPTLEIVVEGLDGFVSPPPVVEGARAPTMYGAQASVKAGTVIIENLERVRFVGDQPPADVARTARGSIKELFSAQKQYNVSASMLGMYEGMWRKNKGHLRLLLGANLPSVYLNELALAAVEAEMGTLHLMVMSPSNQLGELAFAVGKPKSPKRGKKPPPVTEVSCPDAAPLQKCAEKLAAALASGPVYYSALRRSDQ